MSNRVAGKVALITGAARGQGRAHAVRLAEEGADVIAIDICAQVTPATAPPATEADLAHTVELVEALGRRIVARVADVRSIEQLEAATEAGVEALGRLDIVCANAGIVSSAGKAHRLKEEDWRAVLDVNLTGVWNTCRASVEHLKAAGGGSIVITSSEAGLAPHRHIAHYVASKHGVVGLMRTLALELGPDRIRVNTVHPTHVDTPMLMNEGGYRMFRPDLPSPGREDLVELLQPMHALPVPWVDPVDVSNAMLFLASDEARYVTGAALPVDAGCLLM